jgi:hypothetical protein
MSYRKLDNFDIGAISCSLGLFILYHVYIYLIAPALNEGVPFMTNRKNAAIWIQKHKEKHDAPTVTLAIQTLRNILLTAIFVGGFSLQFAFEYANNYENISDQPGQARAIVISVCMFASFLCWANTIRLGSHLGFLIGTLQYTDDLNKKNIDNLANTTNDEMENTESAKNLSNKSSSYLKLFSRSEKYEKPRKMPEVFIESTHKAKMMLLSFR